MEGLNEGMRRYSIHPLTQAFAKGKLGEDLREEQRAREQWIKYFHDWVQEKLGPLAERADADWWAGLDQWRSYPDFDMDINNLLKAVEVAYEQQLWETVRNLTKYMVHLLWYTGHSNDRIKISELALHAIGKLREQNKHDFSVLPELIVDQGWLHVDGCAWVYVASQKPRQAREHMKEGKRILSEVIEIETISETIRRDVQDALALADRFEAEVLVEEEQYREAEQILQHLMRGGSSQRIKGRIECTIGRLRLKQGLVHEAYEYLSEALEISRSLDESTEMTWILTWLIETEIKIGKLEYARIHFDEARKRTQEIHDAVTSAFILWEGGRLASVIGDTHRAEQLLTDALQGFNKLGIKEEEEVRRDLETLRSQRTNEE
jgi:tetratricopeptide (TPR) repeat protein